MPWTVNGRAGALDVDAERAQRVEHLADRPQPHVRVAVEVDRAAGEPGDGRQEAHDGAGQAAVDREPVRTAGRASPSSRAARLDVGCRGRAAPPAMSEVSRETSGRRTTLGPSARAASTSARLVCDLLPGSETTAATGPVARGAGQGSATVPVARVLVVTRAAYQWAQLTFAAASLASRLAVAARWPASRRASRAARRARQATPGLPSVSTLAISSPPSIETFLKKWMLLVGARLGS